MKSLSSVSFLRLATIVFHLISLAQVTEANGSDSDPNKKMFCVPTNQASDADLLKALDWACSQGIDCSPIQPGAICGNPPTIRSRASFAMNSYYRSKGGLPGACDFSGTATLITEDPSYGNCKYV
ncbi:hypothetical protein F3Y22_tig00112114pilonHSYRG00232 [Hibiscus syriacus]|uniref:X8 domain-containing protein n=1 Tax=Hibiscus syriacus TaxID=106335 RepID=A0A6A2XLQ2_HIBSY|nr:major pollen allergen Ole e 10-like [Hibiscus syriacus]KAE8670740.1 hypothetical protein F3Y22_tig00112114pilonHSYRG00232 [Hibiscus syriacus]